MRERLRTYSNAFLSCYNASTPCFCTTVNLPDLWPSDILILAFLVFNPEDLYVCGAIIMTNVDARVHPVHLMNADWAPGGRLPSDQANRLGLWVRRKLAAIVHIHHRHCYYYSARDAADTRFTVLDQWRDTSRNEYQLSQMDPRDALSHAHRAVHKGERSVWQTGWSRRANVDSRKHCQLSSTVACWSRSECTFVELRWSHVAMIHPP